MGMILSFVPDSFFFFLPNSFVFFFVGSCKRIKDRRKETRIPFNPNFILGFSDYSIVENIFLYQ